MTRPDLDANDLSRLRLLVVSHTPHYDGEGGIRGWGPTVRELDHLATLFQQLVHIAPLYPDPAPAAALPYHNPNVRMVAVPPSGGTSPVAKLGVALRWPHYWRVIRRHLRTADAVHVRCPANIAMLALLELRRRRNPPSWFKYAGNWSAHAGEAISYRVQRRLLRREWSRTFVSVNGSWPDQPPHVVPFFNPSLTGEELAAGRIAAAGKVLGKPVRLLMVSRLEPGKGLTVACEAQRLLQQRGVQARLDVVGDGSLLGEARQGAAGTGITFHGWVARDRLDDFLAPAHFILLPSRSSEGWPKTLSEGMAWGAVPIASAISSIPQILSQAGCGVALARPDATAIADAIGDFLDQRQHWRTASQRGVRFAPQFSYDHHLEQVRSSAATFWFPNP